MAAYPTARVMGYDVYARQLEELSFGGEQCVVNTLNAFSFVRAEKDAEFSRALAESDLLIADGFPVVMAARILNADRIQKIAGNDIFHFLMRKLDREWGTCFFLGAAPATLKMIEDRLAIDYPNVSVHSYSPPYKQAFSDEESNQMTSEENRVKPDVLFVGMTAPKQEKWVHAHRASLHAGVICSIGAVFDFYAGTVKRPSPFWIRMWLEWFIRFIKEPGRLWKRYFIYSPLFFWHLLIALLTGNRKIRS